MTIREEDPRRFRANVEASWAVMSAIVAQITEPCQIMHLEPHPGVGYDCLSLVTPTERGEPHVRIMMNRNGETTSVGGHFYDATWEKVEEMGPEAVADELVDLAGLAGRGSPDESTHRTRGVARRVLEWIVAHRMDEFYVGPPQWPGAPSSSRHALQGGTDDWSTDPQHRFLILGLAGSVADVMDLAGAPSGRGDEIARLARDIAQCARIAPASADTSDPCHTVLHVAQQLEERARSRGYRQVPEAWVGDLEQARVMILSSNPAISWHEDPAKREAFPLGGFDDPSRVHPDWPVERVVEFQTRRLDQRLPRPYVRLGDGSFLSVAGTYAKNKSKYWPKSFAVAREVLGDAFDAERDLVLTEVVHCKSQGEIGVASASVTCAQRYLERIVRLSAARLIVVAGAKARDRIRELVAQMDSDRLRIEVTPAFGVFPTRGAADDSPTAPWRSEQLGLLRIDGRSVPLVALQQLTMGSNPYRSLGSVLSGDVLGRLSALVRATEPLGFRDRGALLDALSLR